jgi:glycosyltransferase EpsF
MLSSRIRVLVVLNWLNRGGIETMMLRAVPHLARRGVSLDFCCLGGEGHLDDAFRDLGCQVHLFPRRTHWARGRNEVAEILKRSSYDVIHSQFGFTSGGIINIASEHRVPCIVSIHNTHGPGHRLNSIPLLRSVRNRWLDWHRDTTLREATRIAGHSQTNLDAYFQGCERDPARERLVYNGVETPSTYIDKSTARTALGLDPNARYVLHVGAMKPQKNHYGLVEAFTILNQRHSDLRLLLVGDGTLRPEIERMVKERGLSHVVFFLGARSDVNVPYAAADVFLFPSHFEGFGNVLVEAQVARIPVVATDIPPIREAVCPVQHRFLFPLSDYELAANLVSEQLQGSAERDSRVSASDAYARANFSIDSFSERLSNLYREVLK